MNRTTAKSTKANNKIPAKNGVISTPVNFILCKWAQLKAEIRI